MNSLKTYLESKGLSSQFIAAIQKGVLHFISWCDQEQIQPENATQTELISYIRQLQIRKVKMHTIQGYLGHLKHYYKWLIATNQASENPAQHIQLKGIKRKTLHHIIPLPELEQLYQNFPAEYKRNRAMLGILIWQGATSGELQKLTANHLQLRAGNIKLPASKKSNERELQLHPSQILDLVNLQMQCQPEEKLFKTTNGGKHFSNVMAQLMGQIKAINPTIASAKQIRASVITHWLKIHNLRKVQYMAGHRYVSSTESYLINDLDDLQEDIEKYHPI